MKTSDHVLEFSVKPPASPKVSPKSASPTAVALPEPANIREFDEDEDFHLTAEELAELEKGIAAM